MASIHKIDFQAFVCALVLSLVFAQDQVRQNLIDTIRRQLEPAAQETITLGSNDGKYVKSVKFPTECCEARQYLVEQEQGDGYLRMTFDDLDLPKGTIFQVHDGTNLSAPAFFDQPYYRKGAWIRPVFASTGPALFLKLTPRTNNPVTTEHVGFKANVWTTNTGPNSWTLGKPFTECPILADAVDGGSLSLNILSLFGKTSFRYDCIWQLRPPKGSSSNLKLFLKITDLDLIDGLVIINNGLSSESEQALRIEGTTSSFNEDTSKTFTSTTGFYIRIQKPVEIGRVNFTFGVFKSTSGNDCSLNIDGKKIEGYKCESGDWCVPHEYKCDGIPQCPDGSDEKAELCGDYEVSTVGVRTTIVPPVTTTKKPPEVNIGQIMDSMCDDLPSFFKKCGDGSCKSKYEACEGECGYFERKCSDGTCVDKSHGTCPSEKKCSYNEKRCSDNTCVDSQGKCRNEQCKDYKPNECRNQVQCYYDSDRCSGYNECDDYSDEENCPNDESSGPSLNRKTLLIVFVTFSLFVGIVITSYKFCCKDKNWNFNGHTSDNDARRAESGPVVAGATTTGSVDHYVERGHNDRNERQQLMNNQAGGTNPAQTPATVPFYADHGAPAGPPPAAPPPAYQDAVDRTTYPPAAPAGDPQLPTYDEAMR